MMNRERMVYISCEPTHSLSLQRLSTKKIVSFLSIDTPIHIS